MSMSTLKKISIHENGLYAEFRENKKHLMQLVHFSSMPLEESNLKKIKYPVSEFSDETVFRPVELQVTGIPEQMSVQRLYTNHIKMTGINPADCFLLRRKMRRPDLPS